MTATSNFFSYVEGVIGTTTERVHAALKLTMNETAPAMIEYRLGAMDLHFMVAVAKVYQGVLLDYHNRKEASDFDEISYMEQLHTSLSREAITQLSSLRASTEMSQEKMGEMRGYGDLIERLEICINVAKSS